MKMTKSITFITHLFNSTSRIIKSTLLIISFSFSILSVSAGDQLIYNSKLETPISEILISAVGNNLVLSWQVDKSAFNYYEVERSYDGKSYTTIGLVLDAPENSNTCLFKDKKSGSSTGLTTWYRIKGIEKQGSVLYSASSSYKESIAAEKEVLNKAFAPNPFINAVSIKYLSKLAGFAEIILQNTAGETLLSKQSVLSKGYNNIQLPGLSKLVAGTYVARLIINGTVVVNQKVVKE